MKSRSCLRFAVVGGMFWFPPVLVGSRLYVKSSNGSLFCVDER